ncbi:hypothetical protein [Rhizobium phage RHph_N46]|nr:hypothetical protein EVC12_282 [Rhizobium phage RHph_I42]QXV73967.1 hypothetical protein [Rhizobium phage RHph_N46]
MSLYNGYTRLLLNAISSGMLTPSGNGPETPYPELIVYAATVIPPPSQKISTEVELIKWQVRFPQPPDDPIDYITTSPDGNTMYLNMVPLTDALTIGDGEATFFRLNGVSALSNGSFFSTPVLQGTVTDKNGSGPFKLTTTNVGQGVYTRASLLRISLPINS